jgi:hypothetical protein
MRKAFKVGATSFEGANSALESLHQQWLSCGGHDCPYIFAHKVWKRLNCFHPVRRDHCLNAGALFRFYGFLPPGSLSFLWRFRPSEAWFW